ncbi:MAG: LacI family DNA-binding transcriptional regulator [Anaerolineaceae bacterium]|nr:LacI family DNA-binding transcriptional regulator [Anaerolineaceae bacterium]
MTTMRDIARHAGVSVGTVSNFFNSPETVSEKTRKQVSDAIETLDFHPHAAARSLKSNRTRRIGIVPVISVESNRSLHAEDSAFLEFLSGINTALAEEGFDLLLSAATSKVKETEIYQRLIGEHQVDAMILLGMQKHDKRVKLLDSLNFPFVTFGQCGNDEKYSSVDIDGSSGIIEAMDHLVALGHQRIAFIHPPKTYSMTEQRLNGFWEAAKQHGLNPEPGYVMEGAFSIESGQAITEKLLALPNPPTAILTPNDISAFGALNAIKMKKLNPGKDISVIGFDNIPSSAFWQPSLTTISQPLREIGNECGILAVEKAKGKNNLKSIVFSTHLVIRDSTGRLDP